MIGHLENLKVQIENLITESVWPKTASTEPPVMAIHSPEDPPETRVEA